MNINEAQEIIQKVRKIDLLRYNRKRLKTAIEYIKNNRNIRVEEKEPNCFSEPYGEFFTETFIVQLTTETAAEVIKIIKGDLIKTENEIKELEKELGAEA